MTRIPLDNPAGGSTGAGRVQDPATGPPRAGRAAQAMPGGTSSAAPAEEAGKTSPQRRERTAAAGKPDPATGADGLPSSAPGRVRAPRTPAGEGRSRAAGASLAGSQALSGAEWRKAAKAAAAKGRRKTTRPASKPPAMPTLPPVPGSAPLITTASCTGCEWTAGPGPVADVDRAAEKHVGRGHSTGVSAELGGAA